MAEVPGGIYRGPKRARFGYRDRWHTLEVLYAGPEGWTMKVDGRGVVYGPTPSHIGPIDLAKDYLDSRRKRRHNPSPHYRPNPGTGTWLLLGLGALLLLRGGSLTNLLGGILPGTSGGYTQVGTDASGHPIYQGAVGSPPPSSSYVKIGSGPQGQPIYGYGTAILGAPVLGTPESILNNILGGFGL